MNIVTALRDAGAGWLVLLRGHGGWEAYFRATRAGLATALVLFYLFCFVAVMLASLQVGVPEPINFLEIMLVQSLWLVALLAATYATRTALRTGTPVLPIFVPGIYALIAYLVGGTLITLVFGMLLPLLWLALVFMLYRLGRAAGQWSIGVSVAFAVLTLVLLVGLPLTLYMLTAPALPAA